MNNKKNDSLEYLPVEGEDYMLKVVSEKYPQAKVYFSFFSPEQIRKLTSRIQSRTKLQIDMSLGTED